VPPEDLSARLADLPDRQFQWLLNRFLQKGALTPSMLASSARVWGIEARVLDNLPRSAREEVRECLAEKKRGGTYRRSRAIAAIAARNAVILAREGEFSIPGLAALEAARDACDAAVLADSRKSFAGWFREFRDTGTLDAFFRSAPRKPLVAALGTLEAPEIRDLFSSVVSRDGLQLLEEDALHSRGLPPRTRKRSLFDALRAVRDFHFAPLAERADLDRLAEYTGADPFAFDLAADLCGFGTVVWALRGSSGETRVRALSPVLGALYEGVESGDLSLRGYGESGIPKYRALVAKTLMILKEEDRF
jgi:hypothetical protein